MFGHGLRQRRLCGQAVQGLGNAAAAGAVDLDAPRQGLGQGIPPGAVGRHQDGAPGAHPGGGAGPGADDPVRLRQAAHQGQVEASRALLRGGRHGFRAGVHVFLPAMGNPVLQAAAQGLRDRRRHTGMTARRHARQQRRVQRRAGGEGVEGDFIDDQLREVRHALRAPAVGGLEVHGAACAPQRLPQAGGASRGVEDDVVGRFRLTNRQGRVGAHAQAMLRQPGVAVQGGDGKVQAVAPAMGGQGGQHQQAEAARSQHGDPLARAGRRHLDGAQGRGEGLGKDRRLARHVRGDGVEGGDGRQDPRREAPRQTVDAQGEAPRAVGLQPGRAPGAGGGAMGAGLVGGIDIHRQQLVFPPAQHLMAGDLGQGKGQRGARQVRGADAAMAGLHGGEARAQLQIVFAVAQDLPAPGGAAAVLVGGGREMAVAMEFQRREADMGGRFSV